MYGARSMRLTYVLKRTFNACFMYGKRTLHILLCTGSTSSLATLTFLLLFGYVA